jgi:MoaA/NifB/PqqE/SkfB family radical SAM enzyme
MCYSWKFPSEPEKEIGAEVYRKLPPMQVVNVTGGEPFMRENLEEIVKILKGKTKRLVISSNGYFTDRIVELFQKNKNIGIRISIEGFKETNDELRGIAEGFDHGIKTLNSLYNELGIRDLGFGMTICDKNAKDILKLYNLSKSLSFEFATAAVHNSFYFHKYENKFEDFQMITNELKELIVQLLKSRNPKDWFRAYFNYGLMNYVLGKPRIIPCEMGFDSFFLDPYGEIYPCNVMQESMGNLKNQSFEEIWSSPRAKEVRKMVKRCNKNCWMVGSVGQQMGKYPWKPIIWIAKHKLLGFRIQ